MSSIFRPDELFDRPPSPAVERPMPSFPRPWQAATGLIVLTAVFWWTFEADLRELMRIWDQKPDYSHGYLVPPLAALFLYVRRSSFPGLHGPAWIGLVLLVISLAVRVTGQWFFLTPMHGWAAILWIAGACWVLGGTRFFAWLLPSITFLFFMVPLPFRAEGWLSYPLQRVATKASTWTFQLAGLPATAQGNTILIDSQRFEVAQACSGLRMLLGVGALIFAYAILSRSSWLEKTLLFLSILPIAVAANCVRIVGTGLVCIYYPNDAARQIAHDVAGWTVIPLAAAMVWFMLAFWHRLVIPMEAASQAELLRDSELLRDRTDAW